MLIVSTNKPEDFNPSVEVAATYVTLSNTLLVLQLASYKDEAGFWGVPCGKLSSQESALIGAKRELYEETGIEADSSFREIGKLYIKKPDVDYIYHTFSLVLDHEPSIQLSSEHTQYKWVPLDEAEELPLMKGAKEALQFFRKS